MKYKRAHLNFIHINSEEESIWVIWGQFFKIGAHGHRGYAPSSGEVHYNLRFQNPPKSNHLYRWFHQTEDGTDEMEMEIEGGKDTDRAALGCCLADIEIPGLLGLHLNNSRLVFLLPILHLLSSASSFLIFSSAWSLWMWSHLSILPASGQRVGPSHGWSI